MNKRGDNGGGSGEVNGVSDNDGYYEYDSDKNLKGRSVWRKSMQSKMKPMFFAQGVPKIGCAVDKEIEGLIILVIG